MQKDKNELFTAEINGIKTLVVGGIAGSLSEAKQLAPKYWEGCKYAGASYILMLDGEDYANGRLMYCFK